uniref:DUF986 family protein n=1 Tax=Salmonella enterica TaxID=28901 RepID=UPI00398C2BA6
MTITDLVLHLFIAALFAYAPYDQFIMPRRNGPPRLSIPLPPPGPVSRATFGWWCGILD